MKKIFTLAVSIVFSSSMFAAAEFFVKISSNGNYSVSLNNQTITSPSGIFRFFDLYPGSYNLKVFENGYNGRILYDHPLTISDGYRTVAELDAFSGLKIIDKLPYVQSSWYVDNITSNNQNPGYGNNWGSPKPPKPPKPKCNYDYGHNYGYGSNGYNNGYGNGNNGYPNNNYPYNGNNGYNYGNLMKDQDLKTLLQSMNDISFDEKKLSLSKTALKDRQLNTDQVHQLLIEFAFEKYKLDLAEYCYDKTIDKNNYYTLYKDFVFSNYSSELDKYINSR